METAHGSCPADFSGGRHGTLWYERLRGMGRNGALGMKSWEFDVLTENVVISDIRTESQTGME